MSDDPLKLRAWRLGGAAMGTHDPAPAKPCPGAHRHQGATNRGIKERLMQSLGVRNDDEIYMLAGLSEIQTKVARLHYDRGMESIEIAFFLDWRDEAGHWDSRRVSVHLYEANRRLKGLGY